MSNEKPVALKATGGGKIFADGSTISGYEKVAESDDDSLITLNKADINLPPTTEKSAKNSTGNHWYQKPVGIVTLGVIVGIIVFAIQQYFS